MFAKVFSQIFDSSIAEDHLVRHVFIDFLILSDRHGVVDMTVDAIARRTNVPVEMVQRGIERLSQPDPKSRSDAAEGRRITLLDSHRDWGWQIVNYQHYRNIVDEESRRAYFRDKQRAYRASLVKDVSDNSTLSKEITHAEAEADVDVDVEAKAKVKPPPANAGERATRIPPDFQVTDRHRKWAAERGYVSPDSVFEEFVDYWKARVRDAKRLDWDATFRNRITEISRRKGNGSGKRTGLGYINQLLAESEAADSKLAGERRSDSGQDRGTSEPLERGRR